MPGDPLNREFSRLLAGSGWTQAEAARQLSLTPAAISRYLSGETRPSVTVIRLLKLLLHDTAPMPVPAADRRAGTDPLLPLEPWEGPLLAELRQLDAETRRQVVRGLRTLIRAYRGRPAGGVRKVGKVIHKDR
jgi:transcriptional regulator with XRE-family HTH domain